MRYELDVDARSYDGGRVLVGGSPPKLMRLSAKGAATIDRLDDPPTDEATVGFIARLAAAGLVHPVPTAGVGARFRPADVTIVVPVRDRVAELERCLRAIEQRSGWASVMVVDDGSLAAAAHRGVAERHGAALVRAAAPAGPAAARNAGLARVTTELVAFVDSDIEVSAGWLGPLLALLDADGVVLIAPRVGAPPGPTSVVARYEEVNSPLDLGPDRGVVARGARIGYVPAATMLARVDALRAVDGFDLTLEVGEDVDLVWRLVQRGGCCRYEPSSTVVHHHRDALGAMLRRRVQYGSSAALLDERHPGSVAALRTSPVDAGVIAAVGTGHPVIASAVLGAGWLRLARKLANLREPHRVAAALTARSVLAASRQMSRAIVRPWWPVTLALAVARPRTRRTIAAAALVAPAIEYRRRRPHLDPVRWTSMWLVDEVAYSAGVWQGCIRSRRLGPLLPANGQN